SSSAATPSAAGGTSARLGVASQRRGRRELAETAENKQEASNRQSRQGAGIARTQRRDALLFVPSGCPFSASSARSSAASALKRQCGHRLALALALRGGLLGGGGARLAQAHLAPLLLPLPTPAQLLHPLDHSL